jgi:GNAT superfamily N-acetyltransferase
MDREAVLDAFDSQIRQRPEPDIPDGFVERDGAVVRVVSGPSGWTGVTWSALDEGTADAVIRAQVRRFAPLARTWEWKHYSTDRPPDLPDRLMAAGLVRDEPEAFMVADIAELVLDVPPPNGTELLAVADSRDVDAFVSVHDQVFGGHHFDVGAILLAAVARRPPTAAGVVAFAGPVPVAAGRVVFHAGSDFAGLWGGGTLAAWRRRGLFRALVAHRARLAAARGFRYLYVDAMPDSRPILTRLGFVELAVTTPFIHPGGAGGQ